MHIQHVRELANNTIRAASPHERIRTNAYVRINAFRRTKREKKKSLTIFYRHYHRHHHYDAYEMSSAQRSDKAPQVASGFSPFRCSLVLHSYEYFSSIQMFLEILFLKANEHNTYACICMDGECIKTARKMFAYDVMYWTIILFSNSQRFLMVALICRWTAFVSGDWAYELINKHKSKSRQIVGGKHRRKTGNKLSTIMLKRFLQS